MRKPKPSLYLRFRQPDGKQSSYCRAIFDGKSRLRPFWCLVRGTEEHHPEATCYQRTNRDGKGAWESLGIDPAAAWNKATVGKSVDRCKQELAAQRTPPEPAVTTDSYRLDAEVSRPGQYGHRETSDVATRPLGHRQKRRLPGIYLSRSSAISDADSLPDKIEKIPHALTAAELAQLLAV